MSEEEKDPPKEPAAKPESVKPAKDETPAPEATPMTEYSLNHWIEVM